MGGVVWGGGGGGSGEEGAREGTGGEEATLESNVGPDGAHSWSSSCRLQAKGQQGRKVVR